MHFIFQMTPSEVPTAQSSGNHLASHVSVSSPGVTSIIFWKHGRQSLKCNHDEFRSPNDDVGASHTGQWGCSIECKLTISRYSAVHAQMPGLHWHIWPSAQSVSFPVLKSASRGQKISARTFLQTSRLWICCAFMAVVFQCLLKWYFGGPGRRATRMLTRFGSFDVIIESMFPIHKYSGHSYMSCE